EVAQAVIDVLQYAPESAAGAVVKVKTQLNTALQTLSRGQTDPQGRRVLVGLEPPCVEPSAEQLRLATDIYLQTDGEDDNVDRFGDLVNHRLKLARQARVVKGAQ